MPLRRGLLPLLPALALLAGCPDPTGTSAGPSGGAGPQGGPPPAGGPGGGPGGPGGGPPPEGQPPGQFQVTAGEGVALKGNFTYAGTKTGDYRIDFLTMEAGRPPVLAHALTLDAPGPWTVEAPKSFGAVYVVAFVDQDKDGPSPTDPAGRLADAVTIGDQPLEGLEIVISDTPDLGDLTPNQSAGAGGPPPPEGKGPEGAPPTGAGSPPTPVEGAAP
ncbi:hypothetical protein L6R53_26465, partial [Myxococcota bacterium]|nr:hypothetical protein [Myxococcota bacterium]